MNKLTPFAVIAASLLATATAGAAPLIEADWLAKHLADPAVVVVDLRKAEDYTAGHIPGSVNATYGEFGWRETIDDVVGMLPPPAKINNLIGELGITPQSHVVVVPYGNTSSDVGAAARVYWTFKVLGHDQVSLLNGGYRGWTVDTARPHDTQATAPQAAGSYPGVVNQELVVDTTTLASLIDKGAVQPIDARIDEQWVGDKKHPKARIPGAIPTAKRLPQADLIDPDTGKFIAPTEIIELAKANGWDPKSSKPLVSYCNTGHWAATAWFALSEVAQLPEVTLYDGSMVAWTKDESNPTINSPSRIEQIFDTILGNS